VSNISSSAARGELGMSIALESSKVQLDKLRECLRKMADGKLSFEKHMNLKQ
jgi:hypothetical protein